MKVVLIGSGNVATHMARAFKNAGHDVLQIWSATFSHATDLAIDVDAEPIEDLIDISEEADLIVISVKDDAIAGVVAQLSGFSTVIVHTSGATKLEALKSLKHYGVLYPLQTFSKNQPVNFSQVPLCIEASDADSFTIIHKLAGSLSKAVYSIDTDKRQVLHLAAAFACNFVNQLYTLSNDLLGRNQLDFQLLRPLILETAEKVQHLLPVEAQTGPAVRHDEKTLQSHLELLQGQPELKNIYQTLSDSIKKSHQ